MAVRENVLPRVDWYRDIMNMCGSVCVCVRVLCVRARAKQGEKKSEKVREAPELETLSPSPSSLPHISSHSFHCHSNHSSHCSWARGRPELGRSSDRERERQRETEIQTERGRERERQIERGMKEEVQGGEGQTVKISSNIAIYNKPQKEPDHTSSFIEHCRKTFIRPHL